MSTLQRVTSFAFQSHGVQHPSYFQGAGVCGTEYDEIVTGAGISEYEAAQDAIEQLCTGATIRDNDLMRLELESGRADRTLIHYEDEDDDRVHYVSLRYCIEAA